MSDIERAYNEALAAGDACPGCLRGSHGFKVWDAGGRKHSRDCPYRAKHGCPTCRTTSGPHAPGCPDEITDAEQAEHDAYQASRGRAAP